MTVRSLRTRGHGVIYGAVSPVMLAGFSGSQFDGEVVGKEHAFIPFTVTSNVARYYGDATYIEKGQLFRIMVVKVGKGRSSSTSLRVGLRPESSGLLDQGRHDPLVSQVPAIVESGSRGAVEMLRPFRRR